MRLRDGDTLVFFGDSITRRSEIKDAADPRIKFSLNYDDSYVDLFLQRLVIHYPKLDLKTYNLGVGGDTVNGLMERFWELESLKPNWVVLCIGQNDAKTLSPAQFQEQLSYLLEQLADLGCKTVQLTTTPCPYSKEKDEKLLVFDTIIRQLDEAFSIPCLDVKTHLRQIMLDNNAAPVPVNLFAGGCHLSKLGNQYLADAVYDYFTGKD